MPQMVCYKTKKKNIWEVLIRKKANILSRLLEEKSELKGIVWVF